MSAVYLAINERANKLWAVKEMRQDAAFGHTLVRQNLLAETEILKRLRHPHLPAVVDLIETGDSVLIVMDYIEGRPLSEKLKLEGAQPQDQVLLWAKQLCAVLSYLHAQHPPIIYRDIKPSNIMLQPNGGIKLIDFGTAREYCSGHTEDTVILGTRGYAAPEQYGGRGQTDTRTDIYNLGATMYHLLTGHNPCLPPYEIKRIRQWNPALSSGLEDIVARCTQPDPQERYQSCAELMFALEHCARLNHAYKRKQLRKWKSFVAVCTGTLASAILSASFKTAEENITRVRYESYIETAEKAESIPQKEAALENAIRLETDNGKAYRLLLDLYKADGNFSREEAADLIRILGEADGHGRTNEEALRKKEEVYGRFAYETGMAYYLYYEGTGNKALSKAWFEAAKENNGALSAVQQQRTAGFLAIAGYYAQLDMVNKTGDSLHSYQDYWEDMNAQVDGDLAQTDTAQVALMMYRDVVYQIYTHATAFKQAQLTRAQLLGKLAQITAWTKNVPETFQTAEEETGKSKSENEKILELAALASQTVKTVYSTKDANTTNRETEDSQ